MVPGAHALLHSVSATKSAGQDPCLHDSASEPDTSGRAGTARCPTKVSRRKAERTQVQGLLSGAGTDMCKYHAVSQQTLQV